MRIPLFLSIALLLVSCYHVERNCADYKTGTFEFTYTENGQEKIGKFTRTETLNIDYYDSKIDTSSIRWVNNCEFILKKLHPENRNEEMPIHMKILSTTKDSYTFEYKYAVKEPGKATKTIKGVAKKVN